MMKFIAVMFLLVVLGDWAEAQEVAGLKLPTSVRGAPGQPIKVKAESTAKKIRWKTFDAGLTLLDRGDLADPLGMIVFSCRPGKYTLYAWASQGEDATDLVPCQVVVDGDAPTPPPPGPDVFAEAIKSAYAADAGEGKADQVRLLAAVWHEAVKYANNPQDATLGALLTRIKQASASLLPPTALAGVRKRISEECAGLLLTNPDAPLDAATREKAAGLFTKIAATLEGLK